MALVLTRSNITGKQTIQIGPDIYVSVIGVCRHSGQVKIAVDAPKHIDVHREEVAERIAAEQHRTQPMLMRA